MLFLFLLCLGISFLSHPLQAQRITGNPATLPAELIALAEDQSQKEDRKEAGAFVEEFGIWWENAPFSDSLARKVCALAALTLDKKFRLQPHLFDYLKSVRAYPWDLLDEAGLKAWLDYGTDMLNSRKSRKFPSFLEASLALFSDNYLYASRSISWQLVNPSGMALLYDSTLLLRVTQTDLFATVPGDTSLIRNTQGIYWVDQNRWEGSEGRIAWERVGYSPEEVYAELPQYSLDLRSTAYLIDSVILHHSGFLDRPLLGQLEEKLMMQVQVERASYPRFRSYLNDLAIRDIFPGISYYGGFQLHGDRVLGTGENQEKAVLEFTRNKAVFIRLRSPSFAIHPDRISAERTAVSIYHDGDSIFHPGVQMRYLNEKRELSLLRSDEGIAQSPFMDTWHNLDLYVSALYWNLDDERVHFQEMKGIRAEGRALFESADYYSRERYELLQGIDDVNPLDLLYRYASRGDKREFGLEAYVDFVRKPPEQVKAVLLNLAGRGFLNYDLDQDRIQVKERLFKYIRARAGRADYDVIQMQSVISALPNATLSLLNFDLTIRGIPRILLSDSQQVIVAPHEQEIVMKKNRSFTFDGRAQAGHFLFVTRESTFSYEDFKIAMPVIDEMQFRVRSFQPDGNGFYSLEHVQTVLRDLSGEIRIDKPFNKSGKDPQPEYPIFTASSEAFVYFDDPAIWGGVYHRDRFNYRIRPFTIERLDDFQTTDLTFEGYLYSGGIFPDIEEPLRVQPDYSLGFVTQTPVTGYPAYGGKGTYTNVIDLSNKGLRGRGDISYLNARLSSEEIIFFPDSAYAKAETFSLKEQLSGPEYPMASGSDVKMLWLPYEDVMHLKNRKDPFLMYGGESTLDGRLALRPDGLKGAGELEFEDALMASRDFDFLHHEFKADTADFSLKAFDLNDLAFTIRDYRAHADLQKRKAEFWSNGGVARVEFPLNDYITFMDECVWLMDESSISLRNTKVSGKDYSGMDYRQLADAELTGSAFISIHPAQDSLRFLAERGVFDLKENVIRAEGVQLIKVADAAIFPAEQKVSVYKKAEMGTLENAVVLANLDTKHHLIHQSTINVHSRQSYGGKGVYHYIDESGTITPLHLHRVGVEDGQSYALADIADSAGVFLSPAFAFQGKARMDAADPLLLFDGGFRIAHDCDTLRRPWIAFSGRIHPDTVRIPLPEELKSLDRKNLDAGMLFSSRSEGMYPAFLQYRNSYSDQPVLSVGGAILYDKASQEYRIASEDRLKGKVEYGSYLSLSLSSCEVLGEGPLAMSVDFGQFGMEAYGAIRHLMVPDSTRMRLSLGLDFFLSEEVLEMLANDLESASLAAIDMSEGYYLSSLYELLGRTKAEELVAELNIYGSLRKMPSEMMKTMAFSDLTFAWNKSERAWISEGSLGLASVAGRQMNREIPGKIVIERKRSGDVFTMYLEAGAGNWYLFSYSRGLMQVMAADKNFNDLIRQEKPEDRTLKVKKGESTYRYIISTERKRRDFLRRYMGEALLDE